MLFPPLQGTFNETSKEGNFTCINTTLASEVSAAAQLFA
jgi:hypothetical protein